MRQIKNARVRNDFLEEIAFRVAKDQLDNEIDESCNYGGYLVWYNGPGDEVVIQNYHVPPAPNGVS